MYKLPRDLSFTSSNDNNVLLGNKNIPTDENIHIGSQENQRRKYINLKLIQQLAEREGTNGITFKNVMIEFDTGKKQAQLKIKNAHNFKVLFTAKDLRLKGIKLPEKFKDRKPQIYYAKAVEDQIIKAINDEYKNILLERTGVISPKDRISIDNIQKERSNHIYDIIVSSQVQLFYIHKLQILLSIPVEYYNHIDKPVTNGNKAKIFDEIIGKRNVKYIYYTTGTVEIFVTSSNNPFKISTEENINVIFAFLGQVRDRITFHINDPHERITPQIMTWILKQFDINKDVELDFKEELTLPDLQIEYIGKIFRMYIKHLENKSIYRIEESRIASKPILPALTNIFNPQKEIEQKLDLIIKILNTDNRLQKENILVEHLI